MEACAGVDEGESNRTEIPYLHYLEVAIEKGVAQIGNNESRLVRESHLPAFLSVTSST